MTLDEKRIALAEWMGWTQHENGHWYLPGAHSSRCLPGGQFPPPLTLDWLHECEEHLKNTDLGKWAILDGLMMMRWHTTAEYRLDALLKTLGKL